MARRLPDLGVKSNAKNYRGEAALHVVSRGECDSQDGVRIARLLEHGANMNEEDEINTTALHVGSLHRKYEIVRLLLSHNTEANAEANGGETASHRVAHIKYGSPEYARVARVLLVYGIDVDARCRKDRTPLHFASNFGKPEIAQLLLDHGANVNAEAVDIGAPLHVSSMRD